MSDKILKTGAITSALVYAFCWQLPLVLAGLGLGSFTFAVWVQEYRWLFLAVTVAFLAFAFYRAYRDRVKTGPWGLRFLYGTAVLSLGLVIYSLLYR